MPNRTSSRIALLLACFHILIVASSNYLVQFPITVFGFKATWGAFTFPFIFLATDLTVRILGAREGRRVIFYAMLPALIVSYIVTVCFRDGEWLGFDSLLSFNLFVARIAIASFSAYVIGQLNDIFVFNKLRQHKQWWHAPLASAIFGNFMDTFTFFIIAFYKTSDAYLANNLLEIATVDYAFKILINSLLFLPLYKVILDRLMKRLTKGNNPPLGIG
ncbi:MAG: 7-cyano-7-deazaguanine/7-aminomethyl-7-deazaguanine transporter [Chitinophagaceae bacterium]|nr:7-cyano-7-deazaguanine/7-aminomethyl-7-deazaguanine transporter [Chitinophagaceae bacterium]MCW5913256.1 7-cyano-7-deazaguanine/7-aminomethyl-7-deazaguanine transporter [Chitinophagaceae bacterium]MCZ2397048.1 7-cyano-7-deazaguanine/7-aminomethyl-7-deazaguanine transporter [Chitinophagales bacterium]